MPKDDRRPIPDAYLDLDETLIREFNLTPAEGYEMVRRLTGPQFVEPTF